MITEDYVSFDTARLLKEKGFKEWCYKCYGIAVCHKGVPLSFDEECELKDEGLEDEIEYVEGGYLYDLGCDNRKEDAKVYAAPTLWVAMKWLREKHNQNVTVKAHNNVARLKTIYYAEVQNLSVPAEKGFCVNGCTFKDTYEEACEDAIKYCLENLI